ncbi:MAG: saccharopine dehydrogenase C-terminal domain-containing protein [Comamonadaceae bacterium]|jgi:homospermidine synthase
MHQKYVTFTGRLVMVGFGAIGQGVLPLLLRHIHIRPEQIVIITADEQGLREAQRYGVRHDVTPLTRDNYRSLLEPLLRAGDFLLHLAVDVSSVAMISYCKEKGALYLDIGIEHWAGHYNDPAATLSTRTNYHLREEALALRGGNGPTAILTHGANPGWVSHFVKQALLDLAKDGGLMAQPQDRTDWACLARDLGVKVIQVSERDWQTAQPRRVPGEFVNTWSVDGLINESLQPAELGWGSHEKCLPPDGLQHGYGPESAIYLSSPGAITKVRTWTPIGGPLQSHLITHGESISLADYLSVGAGASVSYRPTVYYAYHPCDDTICSLHELVGRELHPQSAQRVLRDEIVDGIDELGVFIMGTARGAYWYGSRLSTEETRRLAPYNSATTLQVSAGAMAGVIWAMKNPARGIVEPEDLPFEQLIALCQPYLGEVVGVYTDWTPLDGRSSLFPEDVDDTDPWQFGNFRIGGPAAGVAATVRQSEGAAKCTVCT